jgi:hypothetical protein
LLSLWQPVVIAWRQRGHDRKELRKIRDGPGEYGFDLAGAVDASFIVKKNGSTHALICDGTNDGEEGLILSFKMGSVVVGTNEEGDETTAPVVVPTASDPVGGKPAGGKPGGGKPGGGGPAEALLAKIKGHAATALKTRHGAIDALGESPDGPQFPARVRVVQEETWRQWFNDATEEAVTADTKKPTPRRSGSAELWRPWRLLTRPVGAVSGYGYNHN